MLVPKMPRASDAGRDCRRDSSKQANRSSSPSARDVPEDTRDRETPLAPGTSSAMSSKFSFNFSKVRIRTGESAARRADSLGGAAYTEGTVIGFAPGWYNPSTEFGRHVIAHELTHVVQQANGTLTGSGRNGTLEREAETTARSITAGRSIPPARPIGPPTVSVQGLDPDPDQKPAYAAAQGGLAAGQIGAGPTAAADAAPATVTDAQLRNWVTTPDGASVDQTVAVEIARRRGELPVAGITPSGPGYRYGGKNPFDPSAVKATDPAKENRAEHLRRVVWEELKKEGGESSLNTWDIAVFTWGKGFAATGGLFPLLDKVFADPGISDYFLLRGVSYTPGTSKDGLRVVESASGKVDAGAGALSAIQQDKTIGAIFSSAAEDPKMGQAITDAQWSTVVQPGKAATFPKFVSADDSPWTDDSVIQVCAHIVHWWPVVGWNEKPSAYAATGGVLRGPTGVIMAWGRLAAGSPESNGAYIVSNPDTMVNFSAWGNGVFDRAIRDVCPVPVPLTKHEAATDPAFSSLLLIQAPAPVPGGGPSPGAPPVYSPKTAPGSTSKDANLTVRRAYYVYPSLPTPGSSSTVASSPYLPQYVLLNGLNVPDIIFRLHGYQPAEVELLRDGYTDEIVSRERHEGPSGAQGNHARERDGEAEEAANTCDQSRQGRSDSETGRSRSTQNRLPRRYRPDHYPGPVRTGFAAQARRT